MMDRSSVQEGHRTFNGIPFSITGWKRLECQFGKNRDVKQAEKRKLTDNMRASMDNISAHYRNIHTNCSADSRCRNDDNYKPSRLVLTDSITVKLLESTLRNTDVYKHVENYVHYKDTFFVESFNNTLNIIIQE